MKSPVETVRLSDKSKDLLVKIKRVTGVPTWNVTCRLAFCLSLRDESFPPPAAEGERSAIEMPWKVFAGEFADIYSGLLLQRFNLDQAVMCEITIDECLRRHIFRGLGSLDAITNQKNQGSLRSVFEVSSAHAD